jgi:hypothetical protein
MSGKKRSIEGYCFDCDLDFTVKINEDDVNRIDATDIHCPFCGVNIEALDDEDSDDSDDVVEGDDWS